MSVDNWDQEHHLTPRGWISGSSRYYGRVDSEVPRPDDAVETWEEHCEQRSAWSSEDRSHRLIWHDPAVSQADRDALRARFPSPYPSW